MATKKPKLALELLVIRFNFTGLQTYVTSEGEVSVQSLEPIHTGIGD